MINAAFPLRRALVSVSDKNGLIDLANGLIAHRFEIISTGGSAKLLKEHQVPVKEVTEITGFPEIMDGRVKTLHPLIHGGILSRRIKDEAEMLKHGIAPIDLVIVNLYPFEQTIARKDCTQDQAIENIDIGGPTMIRAAAKNHKFVTVVVDPNDYSLVLKELAQYGDIPLATRQRLAQKAFAHTAKYDAAISVYFENALNETPSRFPASFSLTLTKQQALRYGENPHQQAAFYRNSIVNRGTITSAEQLQGKELSFNNINDTDTALECVKNFKEPACVIVKHANPCGVALGKNQLDAYQRAYLTDPQSAFGGIIAFNQPLTADTAQAIIDQQFAEVIIAPEIESAALTIFAEKPNLRILCCGYWDAPFPQRYSYHTVHDGMLIQEADQGEIDMGSIQIVTHRHPTPNELRDLLFAWKVVKYVKSNAIVYAKDQATIGIGAGQMSRVMSATIAGLKAEAVQLEVAGSVMASDAFFPFPDSIQAAAKAAITAIIQPGGSIRDEAVIEAANAANIAMVFTGMRHFRH